jgi:E3 ubiquitin-protein ligase TRIP12
MRTIAKGPVQLDVNFVGELGVGIGPTREFVANLAREFCRKATGMWRTDVNGTEFAFAENGLFPAQNADPEMFFAFGVLCAKAVSMNTVLPIFLSQAFFKLIKGEPIELSEVDPGLAKSLNGNCEELFGLAFVYPGYGEMELRPNGADVEVDETNVQNYISKIKEFTIGSHLNMVKQRFIDGFSTIFQTGIWHVLNANEFRRMITGEDIELTMSDLVNYVEISHGYSEKSKQIQMLFELIVELTNDEKRMFLKFITGSERLPIGGLSALQPRLSVARRSGDENSLPSVMTCMHYLKLPGYDSKEIMRAKILTAISECQESFLFT